MDKKTILAGMKRRTGMDPDVKKLVASINEKANDWFGYCQKCGQLRHGTLADLHKPCDCHNDG